MRTVRVIQPFHDKDNYNKVYQIGEVVSIDAERANKLITLNLVEVIKPLKRKTE